MNFVKWIVWIFRSVNLRVNLTNLWIPPEKYTYVPTITDKNKARNLKFQHRWLHLYKWLAYSEIKHSGFYKIYYMIFSKTGGVDGQKFCVLIVKPIQF